MMKTQARKIAENAYFVVEFRDFTKTLNMYDPLVANQMVSPGFEEAEEIEVSESEPEPADAASSWPRREISTCRCSVRQSGTTGISSTRC
jgi:hypothetical protein